MGTLQQGSQFRGSIGFAALTDDRPETAEATGSSYALSPVDSKFLITLVGSFSAAARLTDS